MYKNVLLVTGGNATGKSTVIEYLQSIAKTNNIPFKKCPITDADAIVEAMKNDDEKGGLHHFHPWVINPTKGHIHKPSDPYFPFSSIGNKMIDEMYQILFDKLSKITSSKSLLFIEIAGGKNTLDPKHPSNTADHSYQKLKRLLTSKENSSQWLSRVRAVFHLHASSSMRNRLNKTIVNKTIDPLIDISWPKEETALNIFGYAEFKESGIEDIFLENDISFFHIENTVNNEFFERVSIEFLELMKKGTP
jgi:hypothetical protein